MGHLLKYNFHTESVYLYLGYKNTEGITIIWPKCTLKVVRCTYILL